MWQYMGHHNALEFLSVDFVYPTGFLLCDLSRHADFRDALTIGWSDEPHFSYLPPIWPVLLRVDFNSYSTSRFLFLTITQQFTLESWCNEQLNEDPKDWQNMLTIKRFKLLYRGSFYTLYSQTPLQYGNPLNTDVSLLRTVCFVPGERKPFHFLHA